MSDLPADLEGKDMTAFWDIEDCEIPEGMDVVGVLYGMRETLNTSGYHGNLTVQAYGDNNKNHDFISAGVTINHFPSGNKYERHTKILEDMFAWVAKTPPPAICLLIIDTNSSDFCQAVELLKSRNYTFLLVHPGPPPSA